MYTLVLYDENQKCVDSFTNLQTPVVDKNNVYWHDGFLEGINANFIIIGTNAEIEKEEDVSHLIDQDLKQTLLSEGNFRDKQAQEMQSMINLMLFDQTNFEQDQKISAMQAVVNELMLGGI
jgi:hypothetical protein